jgi:hypothetical protein
VYPLGCDNVNKRMMIQQRNKSPKFEKKSKKSLSFARFLQLIQVGSKKYIRMFKKFPFIFLKPKMAKVANR